MKLAWKEDDAVIVNVREQLPAMALRYFEAGQQLIAQDSSPKLLHRFRLRTKHFRYTLELFSDLYGTAFEKQLKRLKPVQDALGEMNDCATTLDWLGGTSPESKQFIKKRMAAKSAAFKKYWSTEFATPRERAKWIKALGTPRAAASAHDGGTGSPDPQ